MQGESLLGTPDVFNLYVKFYVPGLYLESVEGKLNCEYSCRWHIV